TCCLMVVLFLFPTSVRGATVQAASCQEAHVSAAVSSARDGDTVVIPAGNCTWNTTLVISNLSISLIGAGVGQTVITSGTGTSTGLLIDVTTKAAGGSPAGFFRISGFSLTTGIQCGGADQTAIVRIKGVSKN